jgi:hypothetical protein
MSDRDQTIGDLLGRSLRSLGVTRVFGSSASGVTGIGGLGHLRVDEPHLAVVLADAHGRVSHGRHPGSALLPGRRLHIGSQPGAPAPTVSVTDAATMVEAVAGFAAGSVFDALELELDVDLDAPAPAGVEPLAVTPAGSLVTLSPSLAELGLVVLAGPGVIRAGEVEALAAFATQSGVPVVETFGARGLVPGTPAATVGLQERDAALAGLDDAAFVITVGLDPDEEPPARPEPGGVAGTSWTSRQVLAVEPFQLAALAHQWPRPRPASAPPALTGALAGVIEPLLASDASPLTPARAAAELSVLSRHRSGIGGRAASGAVVAADAGPAGLWVARALPALPGDVVVPARPVRGFAVAGAIVAALDGQPATAVTVTPFDPVTVALLELAGRVGSRLTVVEWGADVSWADARAHRVALHAARTASGVAHVPVPVDLTATRQLIEVAGPVVAWHRAEAEGFLPFPR